MEGWRDGGMEGWRDGGMEGWREGWRGRGGGVEGEGGVEGWRGGGVEGWREEEGSRELMNRICHYPEGPQGLFLRAYHPQEHYPMPSHLF